MIQLYEALVEKCLFFRNLLWVDFVFLYFSFTFVIDIYLVNSNQNHDYWNYEVLIGVHPDWKPPINSHESKKMLSHWKIVSFFALTAMYGGQHTELENLDVSFKTLYHIF